MNAIQKMIAETVAIEVRSAVAAMLQGTQQTAPVAETPRTVKAPRGDIGRRRGGRVVYMVVSNRRGRVVGDSADFGGQANVERVYGAIRKARKGITAIELETATGLGKKAVESAVWQLRKGELFGGLVASHSRS